MSAKQRSIAVPTQKGEAQAEAPLSRTDWVTMRLRQAVLSGEFAPNEPLRAGPLAQRWDVSPTPLREAFQRLAAEGLLVATTQRGVRVAPLSTRELRDIYELRTKLESDAVRRSVERADLAWRGELDVAYKALDAFSGRVLEEYLAYDAVHTRFHEVLRSNCDSAWLLRLVNLLADQSVRYRASWLRQNQDQTRDVEVEHQALYQAARGGEADRAAALTVEHLQRTLELADENLEQWNVDDGEDADRVAG